MIYAQWLFVNKKLIYNKIPGHGQDNVSQSHIHIIKIQIYIKKPHPTDSDCIIKSVKLNKPYDLSLGHSTCLKGPIFIETKYIYQNDNLINYDGGYRMQMKKI